MLQSRSLPDRRRAAGRLGATALTCALFVAHAAAYASEGARAGAGDAAARSALTSSAEQRIGVTGKVTTSPVLGARAPDGSMGGTIPSAAHGWQPNAADGEDMYVYVPGVGWELGDTRSERLE